jgi:hypothetical protein
MLCIVLNILYLCRLGSSLVDTNHVFTSSIIFEESVGICEPMQDNQVSDHRRKINFDLMSILNGELEGTVQVHWPFHTLKLSSYTCEMVNAFIDDIQREEDVTKTSTITVPGIDLFDRRA